jgi:hypothetical protein
VIAEQDDGVAVFKSDKTILACHAAHCIIYGRRKLFPYKRTASAVAITDVHLIGSVFFACLGTYIYLTGKHTLSLFKTTATENFEPYVKPQENGAHHACKIASVTSVEGHGILFGADKFSFSVSHFSPELLTKTMHNYELVPMKETTVIVDYRTAGIGSASYGPELREVYEVNEKHIDFTFSFSPEFTGNVDLFKKYSKM